MEKTPRRRTSASRRALRMGLLCVPLCLCLACIVLSRNMRPALLAQAEARVRAIAARAMNDAILASMGEKAEYAELIRIRENGAQVYLLQADTRSMNLLAADCVAAAQERIASLGEQGVSVPLGTLTGAAFLSGKGPPLRVSFAPAASVQSAFSSEFVSAGINQTLYRVKLRLSAQVKLILPGATRTVQVDAEAALCESILLGAVPEVYTNVANEEDMLNLIPTDAPD